MYGDLLLDRLGVKFLGPAPLHLELLHMLFTFHSLECFGQHSWVVVLPRLGRRKQIFGNPFPFGNVPCKIQLVPKTVSHTPRALFTHTTSVSEFRSLSSSVTFVRSQGETWLCCQVPFQRK